MNAREEILGRIRAIERVPEAPAERSYRRNGELTETQRVELFCERVADYQASVQRLTVDELREALTATLRDQSVRRVVAPAGFPKNWRPRDVELVEDAGLSSKQLDTLDGVLTGCTVAIAETGTIVLSAGPAEGRRAVTLVPDLHVCIVQTSQIVQTVPEAIAELSPLAHSNARPLTFISGPSATSDIELSRVEGVHGPRRLVVFVVDGG